MGSGGLEKALLIVMGGSLLAIGWTVGVVTATSSNGSAVTVSQAARTLRPEAKTITVNHVTTVVHTKVKVKIKTKIRPVTHNVTVTHTVTGAANLVGSSGGGRSSNCTPGYSPCLVYHGGLDYDCAGGSGNGPYFAYGTITVTGSDPYGLDFDHDGYGCE